MSSMSFALQNMGKQVTFTQLSKEELKMERPSAREDNCILEKLVQRKEGSELTSLYAFGRIL